MVDHVASKHDRRNLCSQVLDAIQDGRILSSDGGNLLEEQVSPKLVQQARNREVVVGLDGLRVRKVKLLVSFVVSRVRGISGRVSDSTLRAHLQLDISSGSMSFRKGSST